MRAENTRTRAPELAPHRRYRPIAAPRRRRGWDGLYPGEPGTCRRRLREFLPVLAHPLTLGLEPAALERAVADLAGLGLVGIEALYGRYLPQDRAGLTAMARRHGLAVTGGSDHHGIYKPDLRVGVGLGDLDVPDHLLEELRSRLAT